MATDEAWLDVIRGIAEGIRRLFALGILTPMRTGQECDRLLNHERGCPEDVASVLRQLRGEATAGLA